MKQLFAAGALPAEPHDPGAAEGVGSPRPSGLAAAPAVRAATAGVGPEEMEAALQLASYAPPPARASQPDSPLPVRLALLNTPSAGRVLAHVTPGCGGRYVAHALLNVPSTADAQLAIQTWGSPQWQTAEPDGGADLPDLPYLPVADVLDDEAIRKWLSTPAKRELTEFVLAALLGTPPHTRIFVAAPADEMAKVVYAVTRALPPGMLDDFTFSTYEPDPLRCTARLIGHDTGSAEWDLSPECYDGAGVAINPATGTRSTLTAEVPFAAFATDALATGEFGPLDDLKATWQRLGMSGAKQFDLVYRLARGTGVLTKEEAAEALQYPPLAAWVSARSDALNQFLEWALDDRGFANTSFSRVVQALRQKTDTLGKLGQTVRELGLKALKSGDRVRTANALEVILPMVAPAKANAVWGELIAQLSDPDAVGWDMRWYLLPRFVRFKQQQTPGAGVDKALTKWIDVPPERLGELLALDVPRGYHLTAARMCLARDEQPSPELARTLGAHSPLTLTLLQPADRATEADADRGVKLFDLLLAEVPGQPWFESLLASAGNYPTELLNRFFETALAAGKVDADRVIRTQGPRLLDLFAGQSGLDRVGTLFLAVPPADLLGNAAVLAFLAKLKEEPQVSDELKERVSAVQAVRAYLDDPTFDPASMKPAAAGLTLTPPVVPPAAKGQVFDAVSAAVLRRASAPELQADLEAALAHFGGVLANDPTDLYENLLRDLRARTDLPRNPNLVHTFLALALGAAKDPQLASQLDGLDGHAFAVAHDAAKRGGRRLLDEIDRRSADWPKSARVQWGFLKAAVKPAGAGRVLRDVLLFAIGAAVASAGWAVATLLR